MSEINLLTTSQVAKQLGIDPSRVRRLADRYGVGRTLGLRLRVYTAADLAELRRRSTGTAGRPRQAPLDKHSQLC